MSNGPPPMINSVMSHPMLPVQQSDQVLHGESDGRHNATEASSRNDIVKNLTQEHSEEADTSSVASGSNHHTDLLRSDIAW